MRFLRWIVSAKNWVLREPFWRIGVPVLVAILTYGPYLLIQCTGGMDACWRIPVAGKIVFDLNSYFTFISRALSQTDRIVIGVFGSVVQLIAFLFPKASVAEIWLLMRWIFGTLTWWGLAWLVGFLFPGARDYRKMYASGVWFFLFLSLGFRPGIYSWFMPFMIVSFAAMSACYRYVSKGESVRALLATAVALACSIVYPWIFMTVAIWAGGFWGVWLIGHLRIKSWILWLLLTVLAIAAALSPVFFMSHASLGALIDTILRNGMAFTRYPVIATALANAFFWIVWLVAFRRVLWQARLCPGTDRFWDADAWLFICTGWGAMILAWLSNVFTGAYIQNDHFRMPMALWIFVTSAYALLSVGTLYRNGGIQLRRSEKLAVSVFFAVTALASLKYLIADRYAIGGDQFGPLHVYVWLSLCIASLSLLKPSWIFDLKRVRYGLLFLAILLGLLPYAVMFSKEAKTLGILRSNVAPAVKWIQEQLPERDRLCLGSEYDEQIASFSKRTTFFTLEDTCASMSDAELYRRVLIGSSLAKQEAASRVFTRWEEYLNKQRLACSVYARERSIVRNRFGAESLKTWQFGCEQKTSEADTSVIRRIYQGQAMLDPRIRELCTHLVISSASKNLWKVANEESLEYDDGTLAIYLIP